MSANREGGQGTQKSGQKPNTGDEQDNRMPGQQRDPGSRNREEEQDRTTGEKEKR